MSWADSDHICYMQHYGIVADDVASAVPRQTGNAAAYNSIIQNSKSGDTLVFPPGYIMFSQPLLPLPDYVKLVGSGGQSSLVRAFSQGNEEIFLGTGAQDSQVENLTLFTCDGCNGGWGIGRIANGISPTLEHTLLSNITTSRFNSGTWYGSARLDGISGRPNYGARRLIIRDLSCGSATYVGLWLGGVNDAAISGFIGNCGSPFATWGLWTVGTPYNPCNLIYASGPVNSTVLMYYTNVSRVDAAALSQVITDNNCTGNYFTAGFVGMAPQLYGRNNYLTTGKAVFSSE